MQIANDTTEHEKEGPIAPGLEILFKKSDGGLCWVDYRDIEMIQERDPEGHTVTGPSEGTALQKQINPGSDMTFLDSFVLTPEDHVFLWSQGISTS